MNFSKDGPSTSVYKQMPKDICIDCIECDAENALEIDPEIVESVRFGPLRLECGRCGHRLPNNKAEVRDVSHANPNRVVARSEADD